MTEALREKEPKLTPGSAVAKFFRLHIVVPQPVFEIVYFDRQDPNQTVIPRLGDYERCGVFIHEVD